MKTKTKKLCCFPIFVTKKRGGFIYQHEKGPEAPLMSKGEGKEAKKDLDSVSDPENAKMRERFRKEFGDRMRGDTLELTYRQQDVDYRYTFKVKPDGVRISITKTNETELKEEGKANSLTKEVTYMRLYAGKVIGMPEILKVLESGRGAPTKAAEKIKEKKEAQNAMKAMLKEVLTKYRDMPPNQFNKEIKTVVDLHNKVYDELDVLLRQLPIDDSLGFVFISIPAIGLEMHKNKGTSGMGWIEDKWSSSVFAEKHRETYEPALTYIDGYMRESGIPYLAENIKNGKIATVAQFENSMERTMKTVTQKLDVRGADSVKYVLAISGVPYEITFYPNGKITWKGDIIALASKLKSSDTPLAREFSESRNKAEKALAKALAAAKEDIESNMDSFAGKYPGQFNLNAIRNRMQLVAGNYLKENKIDLHLVTLPSIFTGWEEINYKGMRPFHISLRGNKNEGVKAIAAPWVRESVAAR